MSCVTAQESEETFAVPFKISGRCKLLKFNVREFSFAADFSSLFVKNDSSSEANFKTGCVVSIVCPADVMLFFESELLPISFVIFIVAIVIPAFAFPESVNLSVKELSE